MHHEKAVAGGIAAEAGALHPTQKDEHGDPLIDVAKIEDYMRKKALTLVEEASKRMGLWKDEAKAAADALEYEMQSVGNCLEHAKPLKKEFIDTMRSMRMTTATEVANTIKPLQDLRSFFLGKDHQTEIERLQEFVELCERLKALKESGFLDSVADTILKLA